MLLTVTVKVRSREQRVEWVDATHAVVHVHVQPHDGQANAAVLKTLADDLHLGVGRFRIIRGQRSKTKFIVVD